MNCSHDMDPHDNDKIGSRDDMVNLPTTLNININDKSSISSDGLEVKYTGENN